MQITFSPPEKNELYSNLTKILEKCRGEIPLSIDRIHGGGNNQIYKLRCGGNQNFIAKIYYQDKIDKRDRLKGEFSALEFMTQNQIEVVPKPIHCEKENNTAIYEFIDGERLATSEISSLQIGQAAQFLITLKNLTSKQGAKQIPLASEACLSFSSLVENLELRLHRFNHFEVLEKLDSQMIQYLEHDLKPTILTLKQWGLNYLIENNIDPKIEISFSQRTLSPSDFGFHNSLKLRTGQLVFFDFEYFGWDDPVKMISDFLLHPGMNLNQTQCFKFSEIILPAFIGDPDFMIRFKAYYPLLAIKWCFIILNEFLKDQMERRKFAAVKSTSQISYKEVQLGKAKMMLNRILTEYKEIPYALSS